MGSGGWRLEFVRGASVVFQSLTFLSPQFKSIMPIARQIGFDGVGPVGSVFLFYVYRFDENVLFSGSGETSFFAFNLFSFGERPVLQFPPVKALLLKATARDTAHKQQLWLRGRTVGRPYSAARENFW